MLGGGKRNMVGMKEGERVSKKEISKKRKDKNGK